MIARVAVEGGPKRLFDYAVPDGMAERIVPGTRVALPFGRRRAEGTVVALAEHSEHAQLRPITGVMGDNSPISPELMRLGRWLADYYAAPLGTVLRGMLPASVRREGGERLFVEPLSNQTGEAEAPPLLTARQRAVLEQVRLTGGDWLSSLTRALKVSTPLLRTLESKGLLRIVARRVHRDPMANRRVLSSEPLALMPEQSMAVEQTLAACAEESPRPILLHGVTGSGKTEVYLQVIAEVLAAGRGAIVLVPEIALTPQTVQRFASRFGETVAVLHSALGDGDRRNAWQRIREERARVVVGPRSAVFAPVARLGLIVVDEEHEPTYKQEETPRYHARDVAVMRARIERCAVLLGSATPSLESWRNARTGKYRLARMPRRVDDRRMPLVRIVDMRIETARAGRLQVFSAPLISAVEQRLARGEQTMLFINRRGFAASLICPACGYVEQCPHCSVTRTYHLAAERVQCHICGEAAPAPSVCPSCADPGFRKAGFGSQRIESIVQRFFPLARVARMDSDATTRRGSHEVILDEFRARRTDILVGTQMIAKGLDFPNVTLVGVLMADMSLHRPDFRAGERTFQLLAQVAGRAGRGEVGGEVIVQTYTPHHPALVAAREHAFEEFAEQELREREALDYPPYSRMVCVTFQGASEAATKKHAENIEAELQRRIFGAACVSSAVPCPLARARGVYRFQILIRALRLGKVVPVLMDILENRRPPANIRVAVDVDALNMS